MSSLRFAFLACIPTLILASPVADAQVSLEATDPIAVVGGSFDVTFSVHTDGPRDYSQLTVVVAPMSFEISGFTLGAGLENYIEAGGSIECDYGLSTTVLAFTAITPEIYDSAVHGSEYLTVHFDVVATEASIHQYGASFDVLGSLAQIIEDIEIQAEGAFVRGDFDGDLSCSLPDAVQLLNYLFANGAAPACPDAADYDDDGSVGLSDPLGLLNGMFGNGPVPDGSCGPDTTADPLPPCTSSCP